MHCFLRSFIIPFLLVFQSHHFVLAQSDTIYIIEKPLLIKKKIYVTEKAPPLPRKNLTYYTLQTGLSVNRDYYAACSTPFCLDYYLQVRSATKTQYNNVVTFELGFISNRFALETSVHYSLYRDLFSYKDKIGNAYTNKNYYHNIDLSIQPGYYYDTKKSKYYLLIKAGPTISYLANATGLIYSKNNPQEVSKIKDELRLNKFNYRFEADISIGRKNYNRIDVVGTLFYAYDLRSLINKHDFFTRQRNVLGLKIGLCYINKKMSRF